MSDRRQSLETSLRKWLADRERSVLPAPPETEIPPPDDSTLVRPRLDQDSKKPALTSR